MTLGWLDLELSSHQRGLAAGLSVEDKDKGEGDDDHGTDDTPEGGYVGDEWEIDVHAKKAGDHGEGSRTALKMVSNRMMSLVRLVCNESKVLERPSTNSP